MVLALCACGSETITPILTKRKAEQAENQQLFLHHVGTELLGQGAILKSTETDGYRESQRLSQDRSHGATRWQQC